MDQNEFEISEERTSEGIKFSIRGRINSINADKLQDKLKKTLEDGHNNIILNMLWVEFLNSAGIRVILKTFQDANRAGGKLGIEKPSQNVKNVLGMTALDEMLIN